MNDQFFDEQSAREMNAVIDRAILEPSIGEMYQHVRKMYALLEHPLFYPIDNNDAIYAAEAENILDSRERVNIIWDGPNSQFPNWNKAYIMIDGSRHLLRRLPFIPGET